MSFNVVLLEDDETFIRHLNTDELTVTEHEEHGKISSLKLKFPISDDIVGDIQDFSPGHKIWVSGSNISRDCLYVINESIDTNIWVDQKIELTVEEVLTELNYAPLITPSTISPILTDGDVMERAVPVDVPHLKQWFGTWFQIDRYNGYEPPEQLNITIPEAMTRMEFLRYIEKETGNIFRTRYVKKPDENIIIRYLDFKRPYSFGDVKQDVVTVNYNADNIICTVDESNAFTAMAPLIKVNRKDELNKWKNTNTLIGQFNDLKIKKGELIPYSFGDTYNFMYPIPAKLEPGQEFTEGTLTYGAGEYFKRVPDDYTYLWYPGRLWTDGYNGAATATKSTHNMNKIGEKSEVKKWKGYFCPCAEDADYVLWNNHQDVKFVNVKIGDYFACNGSSWTVLRQKDASNRLKWVKCLSTWEAPFDKKPGEFYVSNSEVDSKLNYTEICSRPNIHDEIQISGVDEYVENLIDEASEDELDDETGDGGAQPERVFAPKIGSIKPDGVQDVYNIYNQLAKELRKVNYPKVKVKANIKDLKLDGNYSLYDTVHVKVPTIDHLVRAHVKKTDKNPHLISDTKIELENDDVFKPLQLKKPVFRLKHQTFKPDRRFNFKGRLVTTVVVEDDDKVFTRDIGVPNRRVNLAIIRPNSKRTSYTKTITRQGGVKQKGGYDKYGRSPDKSVICGIGLKSTGKDKGKYGDWWKGVFKNRCPLCGKRGGLYWGGFVRTNNYNPISKRRTPGNKKGSEKEGMFTCGYCDGDFSVQGWEKMPGSRYRLTPVNKGAITKYVDPKKGKKEAYKLVKGKLKFSESKDVAKKTTKKRNFHGNTYVHSAVTDKNGYFTFKKLKLMGIEKKDYTFKLTFVGDKTYDSCTGSTNITVQADPKWHTEYKVTGKKGIGKTLYIKREGQCNTRRSVTGKLSKTVEEQAKKIVGTQRGMTAVRLLANWVGKYIKYEGNYNFYQSPARTLSRRRGNCCSKVDLFMHMCEAVNLHKKQGLAGGFDLQYVHTRKRGRGHVFARIDKGGGSYNYIDPTVTPRGNRGPMNKVVDDYKPTKRNKRSARISRYPCLPFGRDY